MYYIIEKDCLYLYRHRVDHLANPKSSYKMKIPIVHNLRLMQIKEKEYKGYGNVYNFKIEEFRDYGPSELGKFGSVTKDGVQQFRDRITQIILKKRDEVSIYIYIYSIVSDMF